MEPYLITLDENSDSYPIFQHEGVEFIYMLEGAITYRHGDDAYALASRRLVVLRRRDAPHGPLELKTIAGRCISRSSSIAEARK